jgi:hypothetical protein
MTITVGEAPSLGSETVAADRQESRVELSPAIAALSELNRAVVDLRADRDGPREQAQRRALPKPQLAKPLTWWRWLRTTGGAATG